MAGIYEAISRCSDLAEVEKIVTYCSYCAEEENILGKENDGNGRRKFKNLERGIRGRES